MKKFLRGVGFVVVAVGLCMGMAEDVFAMKPQEFLNKMEGLYRLQQNIQTARQLNKDLPKPESGKDTTVEFLNSCYFEVFTIILSKGKYKSENSPSPGVLLYSGIVEETAFEKPLVLMALAQKVLVDEMFDCISTALVKKVFPKINPEALTSSQRSSLVVFVSHLDADGNLAMMNPYLLGAVVNTLVEEKDVLMLDEIIKRIPHSFFEGSELI
jgi:hypothetical protein